MLEKKAKKKNNILYIILLINNLHNIINRNPKQHMILHCMNNK